MLLALGRIAPRSLQPRAGIREELHISIRWHLSPRGALCFSNVAAISAWSFVFFQCRSACKGCDCGQVWISPLGILKCLFVNRRSGRRLRGGATQTGGEVEVRPFCVLTLLSIAPPKIKFQKCFMLAFSVQAELHRSNNCCVDQVCTNAPILISLVHRVILTSSRVSVPIVDLY